MSELLKQFGPKKEKEGYKQYTDAFNPFNSWKVAYHTDRMKMIMAWLNEDTYLPRLIPLPPPVYVTVDPTDVCNHACHFCISGKIQESDNTTLKKDQLIRLADSILGWDEHGFKVKSMVLAGGGEPLVNKDTIHLLRHLANSERVIKKDFEFAMISNGELLNHEISNIMVDHATWIGFSVDSGNSEDHAKMHIPKKKGIDNFKIIIRNIENICSLRNERGSKLNIGYKFNIHPDSVHSMIEGAKLAKQIGCNQIQFKPTHVDNAIEIMPPIIEEAQNNIMECRKTLEDENFKVYGAIHKFGSSWQPNHDFGACTMTPLGLIFSADGNMYLCCDRRGEPSLNLNQWNKDGVNILYMIEKYWGSIKHRDLIRGIKTSECPRCTLYHYNKMGTEMFGNKDPMNVNFL